MAVEIIGRSEELLALAGFLEAVPAGGQALLLEGDAGIGKSHLVADLNLLPLGNDAIGAVDVEAEQVLEDVVAVEAAASLTELGDPRPDDLRAAMNRGRTCR